MKFIVPTSEHLHTVFKELFGLCEICKLQISAAKRTLKFSPKKVIYEFAQRRKGLRRGSLDSA